MGTTGLRIDVLGPLQVRRESRRVGVPSTRQRDVLVRLLVDTARPVSADALTEAAYGSQQPERPAGALQTVVSRLRKTLAPEATIELTPAGYLLRGVEVDARRFDHLLAVARAADDRAQETALLEQALELWRGRAYQGVDLVAVQAEAERLEEARLAAAERLAELRVAAGSAQSAVTLLRDIVRADPFRETAQAGLMVALCHAGRTPEALDSYHRYRELLVTELGLDPSPALVEVHRRALANDLAPVTAAEGTADQASAGVTAPVPGLLAPSSSPLVGRAADTVTLTRAVRGGRLVTVVGAGGVGKTRLAAEVLPGLARELGLRLLAVGCEPLADEADLRAAVATTVKLAPSDPDLYRGLVTALDRAPTLLLLDGSEGVRSAVARLATDLMADTESLRVVATSRLPLGCPHEHVVPLAPLTVGEGADSGDADVRILFQAAAQRARPDVKLSADDLPDVTEICRLLDGLPLAIELAGARAATVGLTAVREGLGSGIGIVNHATDSPRRALRSIIEWTYHALDLDAALLLRRLAVAPGPVDLTLATALSHPAPTGSVGAAFDQLVRASLLVPTNASRQSPRYRVLEFVRRFVLSRLTAHQRRRAERALIGWAMELVADAIPGALGPADRTALDRIDAHVANLDLALRLAHRHRRTDAYLLAGRLALVSSHRLPFAVAQLILTLGKAGVDADGAEVGSHPPPLAVAAAARAATLVGDYPAGLELAQRAWSADVDDPDVHYLAAHTLSIASLYKGDHTGAAEWSRRIITAENPPAAHLADAYSTVALAATYEDDLPAARSHAETAQAFALASGASAYRAFAGYVSGEVALREGNRVLARESLRHAVRAAVDAGAPFVAALSETALGSLLVRAHEADAAAGILHKVLAYWHQEGVWPQTWTTVRLIAELCLTRGDHETAFLLFEASRRQPTAPDVTGSDAVRESRLVAVARGHLDEAGIRRVFELAHRLTPASIVAKASVATGIPDPATALK